MAVWPRAAAQARSETSGHTSSTSRATWWGDRHGRRYHPNFRPEPRRAAVDVDDAFEATVEFENGPSGTLEASRLCVGRANHLALEINGSNGSIAFDLERLNELQVRSPLGHTVSRRSS